MHVSHMSHPSPVPWPRTGILSNASDFHAVRLTMPLDPLGKAGPSSNALPPTQERTGFASQPSEHQELPLNLNDLIVRHVGGTFYFRADGPPFDVLDIHAGDVLVIDRVEDIASGRLVVAV